MNKRLIELFCLVSASASCMPDTGYVENPADYVNPFIGASTSIAGAGVYHGLGKTYPGAVVPFGMVQLSPDTVTGGDNASGYSSEMKTIEGFSMVRMSGVGWFGEFGNFQVMPTTGPLKTSAGQENMALDGWRSCYDKATETAEPGYYKVHLIDYAIDAECTATQHCGILNFTFPESDTSRIQIDLARRIGGSAERQYVEILDDNTISGWIRCSPETGGFGNGAGNVSYTMYFYARFDKPLENYGFWSADIPEAWSRRKDDVVTEKYIERVAAAEIVRNKKKIEGRHIGFFAEFPTRNAETVSLKIGISYVDPDGAERNFRQEVADKTFEQVRKDAKAMWNSELGKVKIAGGTKDDKTVFYTALYHTLLDPRIFVDVDGRYVGGDSRIHYSDSSFTKRTIFSGWDVFRSQMPLQTIINPDVVSDIINSLTTLAEQSGRYYYERWEIFNAYSGCMLGNPALSVLADAYAKGIRSFDAGTALAYAVNTSKMFGNEPVGWTPGKISETLEYAYFDWCIGKFAECLGEKDIAEKYYMASGNYENIFDKDYGWFRPRNADGTWADLPENARLVEGYGCTESDPYQQGWFVPHDVAGMVDLMGGRDAVVEDLRRFFEKMPENMLWNPYYNHANEPVHFVPFLFNELGHPEETQKWTRHICTRAYANKVEGLVGNDDAGQMSAWYVLAASGIHPSCPGDNRMQITSPVFDTIEYTLGEGYYSGEKFIIKAHGNSPENIYIQRAELNGRPLNVPYIDFSDISRGGTLDLYMGSEPSKWGIVQ